MRIPNKELYAVFVFSSTMLTYTIQRLLKNKEYPEALITPHMKWVSSHFKTLVTLLLGCSLLCSYSFIKLYNGKSAVFVLLLIACVLSLLYVQKINRVRLRDIPYLKIYLITFVWIIAIGVFPLLNEENTLPKNWCFVLLHFPFILALTIPFDIRDLKYDPSSFKTIPQLLGIQLSKMLSIAMIFVYLIFSICLFPQLLQSIPFWLANSYTLILIIGIHESRNEYYYSGWIEGAILFLGVSYLAT